MRTYTDIARRVGLDERTVRAVAEELEICGCRVAKPVKTGKVHVKAIREHYAAGESIMSIMTNTGFDWKTVDNIARRKTWQHVKDGPSRITRSS